MTKTAIGAVLLAATSLTIATPAAAQRIDRIVAFGDSYADDGNAFQLGYSNPVALQTYPTGRFSGGSNYIDTLAQLLGAPVENFAIGGALAGSNNSLICFDPLGGAPLCGKGFEYEVDQFLNVGAQSTAFPAASTSFTQSDLLAVSIGGNDARFYQQTGGTVAGAPAAAQAAAGSATTQFNRLLAGGTPTISFLAGDTGLLPEIAGNAPAQAVRSAYSAAFNTAMQGTLAGYAANGSIVHYLDLTKVLNNIALNPTAYGLTTTGPCPVAQATACITNAVFRDQHLFYVDALHLSPQGFRIVAAYVAAQLDAPLGLQAASDVALDVAHQWGRTLIARVDGGAPRDGGEATGVRFFLAGDSATRSLDAGPRNHAFRSTTVGATAGVEFGFGSGSAGLAVNASRPRANFVSDQADLDSTSVQIGGYAGFAVGPLFAAGYAGYGRDKHEIGRAGVVLPIEADTKGNHTVIGGKAGYLMPMGGLRVGPVAGLEYARAKVKGYTESGDDALNLNVAPISYKSMRGNLGVEIRGDLGGGGVNIRPYVAALVEKDFAGDKRTVHFAQTSAPTIINGYVLEPGSKKAYGRITGGFSAQMFSTVSLNLTGSATVDKEQGNESSASLGVTIGF